MASVSLADTWRYTGGDSCAQFFTHCLQAQRPTLPEHAHVLEIGSAEFNWLEPAARTWPGMTFTGVDWRHTFAHGPNVTTLQTDAMQPDLFAPASFDWIVSISALEHFGLGHYDADPKAADGDTAIARNIRHWLKPGGWLYFDVPYNPQTYEVRGTECRIYDDRALLLRMGVGDTRGPWSRYYCHAHATGQLIEKPTEDTRPFYYVGLWWQKPE